MKARHVAIAIALALMTQLAPARAANQFQLDWQLSNHPYSCLTPGLVQEGQANFEVNTIPIPTYTVPGSLQTWGNGAFDQWFRAAFSGVLFRVGTNRVAMYAATDGDNDDCTHVDNIVYLRGPDVDRLLFEYTRDGTAFEGETEVALGLREIDPNLADSLEDLKRSIAEARDELRRTAQDADELADGLDRLAELEAALDELLELGFDGISPEMLNALLAAYDDLMPGVRDALVEFLSDLQRDVEELREEIDRISEVFRQQVDAVDDVVGGAPGWDPEDESGFEPIEDGEMPPIDVPDVLGDDPWSPEHDPYADYADEVIASLQATVDGGRVVQRAAFLAVYGAWRHNMDILEVILQARAVVSVGEWGAYLQARNRVLSFVQGYVDDRGWLQDAPIPPAVRSFVELLKDLDVAYRFKLRAEALQLELNLWSGELTERQRVILDVLLLLDALARERLAQPAPSPAEDDDGFWDVLGDVVDTAISFTPVGDFLDACAMITGKEGCWDGRDLTLEERAMYGLGVVVGSGAAWKAAAGKVSAGAVGAVRKVGDVLDDLHMQSPRTGFTRTPPEGVGAAVFTQVSTGISVRYNRRGFPDFTPFKRPGPGSDVRIELTGSRRADARAANKKAGFGDSADATPEGYTWHHHEDVGRMMLVRTDVHVPFKHTGGVAIWQLMHGRTYQP